MQDVIELLAGARVMPVLTVADLADALPLARALAAGGLRAVEVTLRTPAGLPAITAMRQAAPELCVGAGTVLSAGDVTAALAAGAQFLVSPGATPALAAAMGDSGAPCLPGVATASEAMQRAEEGFGALKFFPAEQAGGVSALKSLSGPLARLRFCPTGGITLESAPRYLALPNVFCIGGSWIATDAAIAARDWAGIEDRAREAAAL